MRGKKKTGKERQWLGKKSIGFHYPVGQCHWRVSDPATLPACSIATDKRKACWQCAGTSQNTDLHFKSAKGHHTPRGHAQGAWRSMGWGGSGHWIRAFLGWGLGGRTWSGFHTLPPSSAVWLSYFSPLTLLSLHQLFTFGSTKGNPGALIVAERNSSPSQSATRSFFSPLSPSPSLPPPLTAHLLPPTHTEETIMIQYACKSIIMVCTYLRLCEICRNVVFLMIQPECSNFIVWLIHPQKMENSDWLANDSLSICHVSNN